MNVDKEGKNVIQIGYGPAHSVEEYNTFVHSLSKRARREKILHKHDDLSDWPGQIQNEKYQIYGHNRDEKVPMTSSLVGFVDFQVILNDVIYD